MTTGQYTRRWFTSISIRTRFHIMLAILLIAELAIVGGAMYVLRSQSEASDELARVASVQRSLDRALTIHTALGAQVSAEGTQKNPKAANNPVEALRSQLDATWALPANPEVASVLETLRHPAAQYLESATGYQQQGGAAEGGGAWAFADLEPRRAELENALRDAMTRMRGILHRVETRVIAASSNNDRVTVWAFGAAALTALIASVMFMGIAYSVQGSIRAVREVAQSLAAGDLDNRCEIYSNDEVGGLSRMVNTLADTMGNMINRLKAEAGRSKFSNQLVEALEMADSEAEADRVIARAMVTISEVHPMELLLADSSRAHLERACAHPKQGGAGCPVESPFSCIAVRRGHPLVFPDAEALNACPKLLGRMGGAISAACVPVNFMGRALGVLHVTGAKGKPPDAEQIAQLTALGVHAGNRIGTLRAFERSQLQASTDSLTGLSNRRVAEEVLMNLMASETPFAVVMADLDYFKRLNDTLGHEVGDRALKLFSDTASSIVRDRDHVVRWGGEEFALILPGANAQRAVEVVDRLRAALAQAHLLSGTPIFTASFGVADSTMTRDRDSLIRVADDALYRSKQDGRDRCTVGDPQLLGLTPARRERDQSGAVVDVKQIAKAAN